MHVAQLTEGTASRAGQPGRGAHAPGCRHASQALGAPGLSLLVCEVGLLPPSVSKDWEYRVRTREKAAFALNIVLAISLSPLWSKFIKKYVYVYTYISLCVYIHIYMFLYLKIFEKQSLHNGLIG